MEHLLLVGDGLTLWTICVEFQFYLIFAGLWLLYHSIMRRSDMLLVVLCVSIIVLLHVRGFNANRVAIDSYLHIFLFGLLLEQIYRRAPSITWLGHLALPLVALNFAALLTLTPVFGGREMYNLLWFVALQATLVLAVLVSPDSLGGRVLGSAVMVWLGNLSFGIYLLHRPMIWLIQFWLPPKEWPITVLGSVSV